MKRIVFLMLMIVSITSNAQTYDTFAGGTFAALSNLCGAHLEKDNGGLIVTFVSNPRIRPAAGWGTNCAHQGLTSVIPCTGDQCTIYATEHGGTVIKDNFRLLEDGNVLRTISERDEPTVNSTKFEV